MTKRTGTLGRRYARAGMPSPGSEHSVPAYGAAPVHAEHMSASSGDSSATHASGRRSAQKHRREEGMMPQRRYGGGCGKTCPDGTGLSDNCKGYCNCSKAGQACFCSLDCQAGDTIGSFSAGGGGTQPGMARPGIAARPAKKGRGSRIGNGRRSRVRKGRARMGRARSSR